MSLRLCLLLCGIFVLVSMQGSADDKIPKFNVKTRKMDDTVQVQRADGKVVFAVKSPSGIGSAVIERADASWPEAVALKLHLSGLESLVITSGKVKLSAAVSSQGGKVQVRRWADDQEHKLLDPKSPFWMEMPHRCGWQASRASAAQGWLVLHCLAQGAARRQPATAQPAVDRFLSRLSQAKVHGPEGPRTLEDSGKNTLIVRKRCTGAACRPSHQPTAPQWVGYG